MDSPENDDLRYAAGHCSVNNLITANAAFEGDKDTQEKYLLVVRSTPERLRTTLEFLLVALQFAITTRALFVHDINGEFQSSSALLAQSVFWGYACALVVTRILLIQTCPLPELGLWYHSTSAYFFAWCFIVVNVRSSLLHPYTDLSKWFHVAQFTISTILFINAFSAKIGDQAVKVYTTGTLQPSLEAVASLFQIISFSWLDPMIWKGYRTSLTASDIWSLREDDTASRVLKKFYSVKSSWGLFGRMCLSFREHLVTSFCWSLLSSFFVFGPPFFLKKILEFVEDPTQTSREVVWIYVFGMFACVIASNVMVGQSLYIGRKICIQVRAIIIGEIYAKALRRKAGALHTRSKTTPDGGEKVQENSRSSHGAIINLMSVDAFKVSETFGLRHFFVNGILTMIFALAFLYLIIGWSAFAGASAIIVTMPLNYRFSARFAKYQSQLMKVTDERVGKLNELFSSIRAIKYFAWEHKFATEVMKIRSEELSILRKRYATRAFFSGVWLLIPVFITLVSFGTYTLVQGKPLTAPVAFSSLALLHILRGPLSQLANITPRVLQGRVSIERVENFLSETETAKHDQLGSVTSTQHSSKIGFENATFSWTSTTAPISQSDFKLRDVDISFHVGKLNVIVGPTGSGKSSLLFALLGEMELLDGRVFLPNYTNRLVANVDPTTGLADTVAFCAQQAWLLNDTIRNNILFGSEFIPARYEAVINACELARDLQILEAGDETEIGERGITLSGGQKQRVSLARAVYSNSKHLILDDCLSAVDSHTAVAIYQNAITGALCADRTVILVSHNVALTVAKASHVVAMNNGRIAGQGSVQDLAALGLLAGAELTSDSDSSSATNVSTVPNESTSSSYSKPDLLKTDNTHTTKGKLVTEEFKQVGNAKLSNYTRYFDASGGFAFLFLIFLSYIAVEWSNIGQSYWIKVWTAQMTGGDNGKEHHSPLFYITVYILIGFACSFVSIAKEYASYSGSLRASRLLFNELLESVMSAKVRFFDSTPVGRIMNRFSKDIEAIDQELAIIALATFSNVFKACSIVVLITLITPGFIVPGILIAGVYWFIGTLYNACTRELKRIDSISKSPIFQHFGETLSGVTTIRAYGVGDRFLQDNLTKIDANNRPFFYVWVMNRWLSFRVDLIGALVTLCASVLIISRVDRLDAGLAGISLSYAINFSEAIPWIVRQSTLLEMSMNSVERVIEYLEVDREAPSIIEHSRPPVNWPSKGEIEVKDLSLRYAPDMPLAIKNVSFKVEPSSKVGVVGRTGAGKSTIITAFFRFLEAESGSITIDGCDISTIGLRDLRENIDIIPQDPTLFEGTLRSNLDPFGQHSDNAIFQTLRKVNLVQEHPTSDESETENSNLFQDLNSPVTEGGENLSQGQRQLVCLARSLLKSPKVILLDEATASIDHKTDALIQQAIRKEFGQTTVLNIAHRLKTVIDYDKVLVMDNGSVVEYDTPYRLLSDKSSVFWSMCEKSGELDVLISLAKAAASEGA